MVKNEEQTGLLGPQCQRSGKEFKGLKDLTTVTKDRTG